MTKEKTTLIQKDPRKETAPNNYRPIKCLPMLWKILKAPIGEDIYSMISRGIFSDEQKGCHKGTIVREEQQYMDQHILNESKTKQKFSNGLV